MKVASLEIELMAGISRLQNDMNRATGVVSKSMGAIEKSVEQAKRVMGSLGLGLGLGAAVSQVINLSDSYTKFTAQLKLATTSQREYAQAYSDVQRISKVAQAELGATGVLYARISNGVRELGVGQAGVAKIVETTSLALKVSGATSQESASAMLQLSQAFGSGVLRGQEFNAVNEAAPRLMKALADGMGVPISALREMASEGKITSQVMAEALPKALADLREEAKSVQTIGGSFTVLKNSLLELVGTQAQASGFVSTLTSGIGLLANNLQLVLGVVGTIATAKLASWIAGATVETIKKVAADRAGTAAMLATANANVVATQSSVALSAARLAEVRASASAAGGEVALALALNGVIPAQRRATADALAHTAALAAQATVQKAASVSTGLVQGAMGLLGGPVGWITTLLGLGATAWALWGSKATEAEQLTAGSLHTSTQEIIGNLDKQIAKLRERNSLVNAGIVGAGQSDTPAAQRMIELRKQMAEAQSGTGQFVNLPEIARMDILQKLGIQLGTVYARTQELAAETEKLDAAGKQTKLQEWMTKLATKTEKMNVELAKARQELGSAFTPEIEARIRAQYTEKAKGTAKVSAEEKEAIKIARDFVKEREKSLEAAYSEISAIQDQAQAMEDQVSTYGMSKGAIDALTISRLQEQKAILAGFAGSEESVAIVQKEIEARERLMAATVNKDALDANKKAAEQAAEDWKRTNEQIGDSLTDALLRGFESGKSFAENFRDTMFNMFRTLILQPIIQPVMSQVAGGIQSVLGMGQAGGTSGGTGLGGIMGSVSNLQSLYSAATGGLASSFAGAAASIGSTIGSSAVSSFAVGMQGSTLAAGLAGPTTAGATGAMGLGQAAGSAAGSYLPYVGALFAASQGQYATAAGTAIGTAILPGIGTAVGAVAGMLIDNFVGSQAEVRGGGQYGYSFDGTVQDNRAGRTLTGVNKGVNFLQGPSGGEIASDQVKSAIDSTVNSINGIFSAVGSQITLSGFWGGLETSDKGRGGVMSGGQLSTGVAFGEDGAGSVYGGKKIFESYSTRSPDAEEAVTLFVEDLYQSTIQALQAASGELPQTIRAMVVGVDAESLSAESAQALVAQINETISLVNQMGVAFEALPFENLKNLSFDATTALLQFAGGVEAFSSNLNGYYANFYSEQERFVTGSKALAESLSSIGVAMPELTGSADQVKAAYRAIVDSFDVTTESGQRAYATMITLSGSFAELAGVMEQLNTASAQAAETERQKALQAMESERQKAEQDAQDLASSLMVAFTDREGIIDVSGLSAKLKSATEQAFVQTIVQVFEHLATRLEGVIDGIANERNAIQSAIKQVQNIGVMTPGAIAREISSINTAMPANAGVVAAYGQLSAADALLAQRKQQEGSAGAQYNAAQTQYNAGQDRYNAAQAQMSAAQSVLGSAQEQAIAAQTRQVQAQQSADAARDRVAQLERDINGPKTVGYKSAGWSALNAAREAALPQIDAARGAFQQAQAEAQAAQQAAAAYQTQLQQAQGAAHHAAQGAGAAGPGRAVVDQLAAQYAAAVTATAQAQAAATAAVEGARQSQVDYANAVQAFTIDAGKSVGKLTELRGETMRYYEAQKALADLMKNSAATLRKTALDYRVSQLDPEDQFAHLRGEFDKAYALALSTDGEDLVGYADQLNSMLTPLLAQASDVYATESGLKSFIATALARVENIAGRTDLLAPKNYEADSLALLNQIDATLAALDKSAKSAETIIAEAINSSRDSLLGGLRQIANALVGNPVAAFASGGYHTGGLRLVGERGPELEVTGPSRIYNANQTRSMLSGSGDSSEVVAELRALRAEVADLRIEARATASNTNKIAKQGDRNEQEGVLIRSDTDFAVNGFV